MKCKVKTLNIQKTCITIYLSLLQSTQTSHLPHGLAQFMQAVFDATTLDHQKDIIRQQLAAVESKLKEPR